MAGRYVAAGVLGLIGAGGIGLVIVTAKTVVGRQPAASPFALITEGGYSFPSGHATGTCGGGVAVCVAAQPMGDRVLVAGWRCGASPSE